MPFMRRLARLALLIVATAQFEGRADAPAAAVSMPEFAVLERITPTDPMPERETRWGNPAVTLTDVVYATRPGYRPLRLDLYRETGVNAARPLVVVVHGGGWANANPRVGAGFKDFPSVLGYLAQRGYTVASIEYRLSGEAPFPAQVEDLETALGFLRAGAARFGIDPARVGLWGLSAGAQVTALQAVRCRPPQCVQALVGWFGPYDLAAYIAENPLADSVRGYLRCPAEGCTAVDLAAGSPARRVDGGEPPTLLVHGVDDVQVRASQSQRLAEAMRAGGQDVSIVLIPDVGHGLIGKDTATTRHALRLALEATLEFFDEHLTAAPGP
jgi:acetyl esterase/lipase